MAIGQKKKALIHIAKEDLHLDESTYRAILKGVAGVESAAELTTEGFERVMARFQEMGFRGLLRHPYQPVPKGRLIPSGSPHGSEAVTPSQRSFISFLLDRLNWDAEHYQNFCKRIIKRPEPSTTREGQKMVIGLLAVLRHHSRREAKAPFHREEDTT